MTDQPPQPPPIYGMARPEDGAVVLDVTDAALARLVDLLARRPTLMRALVDATRPVYPDAVDARRALRDDPDVRAACTIRLEVPDAVDLAASLIACASPTTPSLRPRVGARAERGTTTQGRTHR